VKNASLQKVYIETLGCQMNVYDSAKIADVLHSSFSVEKTDYPEEADLLLVNTCSVREKAAEKLFSLLGRWRRYKAQNPHVLIAVGGCVASQEGEAIIGRAPFVDVVFGPQTLHRLPLLLEKRWRDQKPQIDIAFPQIEKFDHLPPSRNDGVSAFVTIMEGCSHYCSFCVVPYTRGEEVSRPLEEVLTEISELALQGVKEVTLLGQNVNGYESVCDGVPITFADLLAFVAEIPGIERVRFTTSHPLACTDALIDAFRHHEKLAPHIHLPAQSGSDRILALMKRGYNRKAYLEIIAKLRQARPDIVISSDFIVGFPTETEKDFLDTLDLVDTVGLIKATVSSIAQDRARQRQRFLIRRQKKKSWSAYIACRTACNTGMNVICVSSLVKSIPSLSRKHPNGKKWHCLAGRRIIIK